MKYLRYIVLACAVWILAVAGFYLWNRVNLLKEQNTLALKTSREAFSLMVVTREWNARHGGVYVPVTEVMKPNPYLKNPMRDIKVSDSLTLTQVNPAYMTRQISEIAESGQSLKFHITSLNPIRPQNYPTPRESAALVEFEKGRPEIGIASAEEKTFFYMAPLRTEKSCLKCHAQQGYEEGDIRGGISITFPFQPKVPPALLFGHLGIGLLGVSGIAFAGRRLMKAYTALKYQSLHDALTDIPNRRSFFDRAEREFLRAVREGIPVAVIMADIDHFKAYNDLYGHGSGDSCLRFVAQAIKTSVKRPGDFCARYGGEEFVILLPHTGLAGALHVAERVRLEVEDLGLAHLRSSTATVVTLSLGVAVSEPASPCASSEVLMQEADDALYQAKEKGRNQVVAYQRNTTRQEGA